MARSTRIVPATGLARARRRRPELRPLPLDRAPSRPPPERVGDAGGAQPYRAGDYLALRAALLLMAGALLGAAAAVTAEALVAGGAPPGADTTLGVGAFLAALAAAVGAPAARAAGRRASLRVAPAHALLAFGAVFAIAGEVFALPRTGAADALGFVLVAAALLTVLGVLRSSWNAVPEGPAAFERAPRDH